MSRPKTLAAALSLVAGMTQAMPETARERVDVFAQCAGRLSAELEHGWLHGQHDAEIEAQRTLTAELLDVLRVAAPQRPADILAMRIESKFAHAALLHRATFLGDPRAADLALRLLAPCRALLLS